MKMARAKQEHAQRSLPALLELWKCVDTEYLLEVAALVEQGCEREKAMMEAPSSSKPMQLLMAMMTIVELAEVTHEEVFEMAQRQMDGEGAARFQNVWHQTAAFIQS